MKKAISYLWMLNAGLWFLIHVSDRERSSMILFSLFMIASVILYFIPEKKSPVP